MSRWIVVVYQFSYVNCLCHISMWKCSAQRYGPDNKQNYIKAYDKDGNTALHLAVQNGSIEVRCLCTILL